MCVLITGCNGFIGYHLAKKCLSKNIQCVGIDNNNDYYDLNLKIDRNKSLKSLGNFDFHKADLNDNKKISEIIKKYDVTKIVHLAAQAGVRYSVDNPHAYIESNINGFFNIINTAKNNNIEHFIYASSSSVYGNSCKMPFKETDNTNKPLSMYAATKKSNELIAHSYSNIHGLKSTGLRFFTVYGPWGRPDMAYYKFTEAIDNNLAMTVFNKGNMRRDFTYIDDVIAGIMSAILKDTDDNQYFDTSIPHRVFNLGNNVPVKLKKFINIIEDRLEKKAIIDYQPMQLGDVESTFADVSQAMQHLDYKPSTEIELGLNNFIDWYLEYKSR